MVMVWASPPCNTYSIVDLINQGRGCNYRDHSCPMKPPVEGKMKYARVARGADTLVMQLLLVMAMAERMGAAWVMENPEGNLKHRPFMR